MAIHLRWIIVRQNPEMEIEPKQFGLDVFQINTPQILNHQINQSDSSLLKELWVILVRWNVNRRKIEKGFEIQDMPIYGEEKVIEKNFPQSLFARTSYIQLDKSFHNQQCQSFLQMGTYE